MDTRSPCRVGVVAAIACLSSTGCASASLGVSPDIIVSTVMASWPRGSTSAGSGGGSRSGGRGAARTRVPPSPAASERAANLIRTGASYEGVRYVWGGNTPRQGFDCSGFTKYVFAKYRITLPRTSREQARAGARVAADFAALRPGDLMFFAEPGAAISHVAIYAGNGWILHSASSVGGVGYTDLNHGGEWFYQNFVVARRMF